MLRTVFASLLKLALCSIAAAADGNRLAYLDGPLDPYYPHRDFPKLITPQWVGEDGVECVVTLAIDDMRESAKYEAYLRPILDRLKQIDGRAAVSIMTCRIDPADSQLQAWLKEGVSIECHSYDHPCPLLQDGGLEKAKATYDQCVDLMSQIPGNKPVAFRVPCCDSKNTPSPRFWAEIFNKTTEQGNFLQIDSSVFNIITNRDKELPRELTELSGGEERFRHYVPFANFVNTIEDYPYPYVIGGMCWEFPCVVPSDWSAQHVQKPNNPDTIRDWKLALDACVIKQGVFNLVFHPHGWIRNDQIVELIDHAVAKHGKKVKFLTFKECAERLNQYTSHKPLREFLTTTSASQGARLREVDVNGDGHRDRLFSDHERYSLHLFKDMKAGWATKVFDVVRSKEGNEDTADKDSKVPVIPPFVRADGTNNGAWFHSGALWLQNEDTWRLPDGVFKLTFAEMLGKGSGFGVQGSEKGGEGAECCGEEPAESSKFKVQGSKLENAASTLNLEPETLNPVPSSDARYDDLQMPPPLSPEQSLKALHVRPGMQVELVAAEPLIVDPVAFDWGPDGRLWVVEMRDYPSGITWHKEGDEFGKPGGRVKVLTDVDGDGRYDKAALFLDNLPFPTGVKVWRKGILVTAAPDILYAEDTDGDDQADVQKTLYRGFGEGNQQHRVNGLRWGLDNWLHVGNGDSGGIIRRIGVPPVPPTRSVSEGNDGTRSVPATLEINVNGRDLRIRPDTGDLDATSGNTQFGRERDDWGNWFGNNNSNPLWHYTLEDHYLRRNPHATYPPIRKDVSVVPGAAPVFPRSKTLVRFNDDNKANRYTSACGPTLYRDDLLGPDYYHNVFVCEPVHNLVSREIVTPQGASFTSRRADDEKRSEFLASEDLWFRPSMVRTGPDGALWVADMYRFVVEHPKWIPLAAQAKLNLRAGDDKGRIYRIYPEGQQPRPTARLDKLDTAGLVAALDSPNGTQRDLAHQMLVWNADPSAIHLLHKLAAKSKRPQTRLQSLCALSALSGLSEDVLLRAFSDEHPAVRRHAIRLSESRFSQSSDLAAAVLKLVEDPDPHIRIQLGYSLGEWNDPRAAGALAAILTNSSQPLLTGAAMSSLTKANIGPVLTQVLKSGARDANAPLIENLFRVAIGLESNEALREAIDVALLSPWERPEPWRLSLVARFLDELERRKVPVDTLVGGNAKTELHRLLAAARAIARDGNGADLKPRLAAIRLVGRQPEQAASDAELLTSLLAPQQPGEVQAAALAALVRQERPETADQLTRQWTTFTSALRSQILDALVSREGWSLTLLSAIESGQVPAAQLDARRRQQLLTNRSATVRAQAEKVFAAGVSVDRQQLVEAYLAVASNPTRSPGNGQAAFTKRCANCHQLSGAGHAVGPDLGPLAHRAPEYLLTQVLDPNRAVEDRYLEYIALTTDGRQLAGILVEETGAILTLAAPEGKRLTIPRSELDQIKSSGKSLMPEGIERDIPPTEMADILAYLRSNAPPPKQLALNQPELVQPFNDGSIRLFATNCRAYGPTIKMEETFRALGWWNSAADHCAWSFEVPAGAAGNYRVTLEYSCAENSAGNTAVVEVAGQTLTGVVASSGGWDRYRGWNLGTVKLPAGTSELVVRSSGPIKEALFDLGGIRLVPVQQ